MKNYAIVLALVFLSGCSSTSDKSASSTPSEVSKRSSESTTPLKGDLEVVAFKGGYGIDFYESAAKEFQEKHPDLSIKVSGDPRVWETLRPRFVADDPPDLVFPGWGMDHWALVAEDQIMPLDDALSGKAAEGGGTWRDTFDPNILLLGQSAGKQWVLPYYYNVMGWWYDPDVFKKHGWSIPKDYDELLALCEQIKAKGLAPITFQGKYPYYMVEGMLLPWAFSVGGKTAVDNAQNLEPGAWKSPAMLQAAKMIDDLNKKGYFQKGAVSMSHTESQQEFVQGRAAMLPCGTWLHSEMKNVMPEGTKIEFFLPPVVKGGKGEPTNVLIGIEPWMVPSKAKNPIAAIELFKYMTSLTKAKQFVEQKGTLMAIKGSDQAKLPEVLQIPAKVMRESKSVWAVPYRGWYPAFQTELENALTSMLNGELTPEQFCDRVEAAAEKTRKDDSIVKHRLPGT